jgi:hypothetical protein
MMANSSPVMCNMVDELFQAQNPPYRTGVRITQSQYDAWRAGWIFDGIRGRRYGAAWCDHFDIQDYLIRYTATVESAHRMIQEWYVR